MEELIISLRFIIDNVLILLLTLIISTLLIIGGVNTLKSLYLKTKTNEKMKLKINSVKLTKSDGYIATVDWTKEDAANKVVGIPSLVAYGDTQEEAYYNLKIKLETKGHTIIL